MRIEELKSRIKIALPSAYPYRKAMIAMAGAARRTRKINPHPAQKIRRQYRRQPGQYRVPCSNHPTTVNNPG